MLGGALTAQESQAEFFKGDEPGSRRASRRGISSAHDSGSWLAWVVPRAGEQPAGGRAVHGYSRKQGSAWSGTRAARSESTGQ